MEPSVWACPVMWVKIACQKMSGPRHNRLAKLLPSEALTRPNGIHSMHAYQAYMVQDARGRMRLGSLSRPHTPSESLKPWLQSARPSWSITTSCTRAHDHRCEADDESVHQMRLHVSLSEHNDGVTASQLCSSKPSSSGSRHVNGGHGVGELCLLPCIASAAPHAPSAVPWSMLRSQALQQRPVDAINTAIHKSSPR